MNEFFLWLCVMSTSVALGAGAWKGLIMLPWRSGRRREGVVRPNVRRRA